MSCYKPGGCECFQCNPYKSEETLRDMFTKAEPGIIPVTLSHEKGIQPIEATPKLAGVKHDSGKEKASLLPSTPLLEIAKVLTYGEQKYGSHNWRQGFVWSRVMDAAYRHLLKYNGGEKVDPETGLSHLTHAATNLLFLIEFEKHNIGENDLWSGHGNEGQKRD